jgi:hypothetical protein
MKIRNYILFVFAAVLAFTSCRKDETTTDAVSGKIFTINATSYTKWAYFSFEKNDTVSISNPKESTEWDIAFQRNLIITNSGKSGIGLGGAFKSTALGQGGFNGMKEVPAAAIFTADDSVTVYGPPAAGTTAPTISKQILNSELYGWYEPVETGGRTVITPLNQIYLVKTATGKYVKLWIMRYYNDTNASGYIKIQYICQPDGTTNLNITNP